MKRRDYLKSVGSIAIVPLESNRTARVAATPDISTEWMTSVRDGSQILQVETTHPVDSVELSRYEFGSWSTMPQYQQIDDRTYEFVFDSPTTIVGSHSVTAYRSGKKLTEMLLNLNTDLLTRHIEVSAPRTGRVAVRQKGDAAVAVYNGAVVTATQQQPDLDDVARWQNQRYISLLPEYTDYVQAYLTEDALNSMLGNQAVWVWLRSENDAWYPATVNFNQYDPVEVYELHGVTRR